MAFVCVEEAMECKKQMSLDRWASFSWGILEHVRSVSPRTLPFFLERYFEESNDWTLSQKRAWVRLCRDPSVPKKSLMSLLGKLDPLGLKELLSWLRRTGASSWEGWEQEEADEMERMEPPSDENPSLPIVLLSEKQVKDIEDKIEDWFALYRKSALFFADVTEKREKMKWQDLVSLSELEWSARRALPLLKQMPAEKGKRFRAKLSDALGQMEHPEAMEMLCESLQAEPQLSTRCEALRRLIGREYVGTPKVLACFFADVSKRWGAVLHEPVYFLRLCEVMGQLGRAGSEVVPFLRRFLGISFPACWPTVSDALHRIEPAAFDERLFGRMIGQLRRAKTSSHLAAATVLSHFQELSIDSYHTLYEEASTHRSEEVREQLLRPLAWSPHAEINDFLWSRFREQGRERESAFDAFLARGRIFPEVLRTVLRWCFLKISTEESHTTKAIESVGQVRAVDCLPYVEHSVSILPQGAECPRVALWCLARLQSPLAIGVMENILKGGTGALFAQQKGAPDAVWSTYLAALEQMGYAASTLLPHLDNLLSGAFSTSESTLRLRYARLCLSPDDTQLSIEGALWLLLLRRAHPKHPPTELFLQINLERMERLLGYLVNQTQGFEILRTGIWRVICLHLRNRLQFLPNWPSLQPSIHAIDLLIGRLFFLTQKEMFFDYSQELEKTLYT